MEGESSPGSPFLHFKIVKLIYLKNLTLFKDGKWIGGQSILIKDGKIRRIGKFVEAKGAQVYLFDEGTLALPGFIDSHSHLASWGLKFLSPNLNQTKSIEEALQIVSDRVKELEGENPLIFEGFDQSKWKEKRLPTRSDLDKVAPSHPVILRRICGHIAVANTLALKKLKGGIRDWERGILDEGTSLSLRKLFPPSREEWKLAILKAQEEIIGMGITMVHEFGRGEVFNAYWELKEAGLLKVRVRFNFYERDMKSLLRLGISSGFGDDILKIGGIKIFVDGSVGARTAAFFKGYRGVRKRGLLLRKKSRLEEAIRLAEEGGLQLLIHAIGDRAIRETVQSFKGALLGGNPLRHRIEHFEFPGEEDLGDIKKLGICLSMQPNFVVEWGGKEGMYREYLGDDYWRRNNPFGEIKRMGIKMAFGSDSMPFGPVYGMRGAVFHPVDGQSISLGESIRCYTENGAYLSFDEEKLGKIEEGYLADIVIFPKDFLKLKEVKPIALFIDGSCQFIQNIL
jgi:hypothetical protein